MNMAVLDRIPFNKAYVSGQEYLNMAEAVRAGHISGDGNFTKQCHAFFEKTLGVKKALLTTSCTHALEMAALLLNVGPGDEVIVPSFTFVSTANAFALRGARIVFADIDPDTLNMDVRRLESLITPRTKAIVVVHYAGVGCDMDVILAMARRHGVEVVEDNAHGLFGRINDQWLGTFAPLATLSFHETKNFSCGEGGALLINDERFIERAEILREKGTNRSRFFRGQVDKYTWVDVGSSYLPSDILAAFLLAQLEQREHIQKNRRRVWDFYHAELQTWAAECGVLLPHVPANCEHPYHMFYLLMPSLQVRQDFIAFLKAQNILSVFHYVPLHLSELGQAYGGYAGMCPVTEDVSDRIVRLPFFVDLSEADLERIVTAIRAFPAVLLRQQTPERVAVHALH